MSARLTERQRRFAFAYLENGCNGTRAAREVGYKGDARTLAVTAVRLLRKPKVQEIIAELVDAEAAADPKVKDREARQKFWSDCIDNPKLSITARLRASELLGKSQGDFIDRHVIEPAEQAQVHIYIPDNGRDPTLRNPEKS